MSDGKLLVIVPAYNEEEALPDVLVGLSTVLPLDDVLVVDDGSIDQTAEVARELGARVAPLSVNLGIGGALRTGFRYAMQHGYAYAVQFDADGQHLPDQIGRLLHEIQGGANLAIGSRFASDANTYRVSRTREGAMRLLRLIVRLVSGRSFTDTSSGFRAFDRAAIEMFAMDYPAEYMDSVEALVVALRRGLEVVEVPVQMRERSGGEPSHRHLRLIYHFFRVLTVIVAGASLRGRRTVGAKP